MALMSLYVGHRYYRWRIELNNTFAFIDTTEGLASRVLTASVIINDRGRLTMRFCSPLLVGARIPLYLWRFARTAPTSRRQTCRSSISMININIIQKPMPTQSFDPSQRRRCCAVFSSMCCREQTTWERWLYDAFDGEQEPEKYIHLDSVCITKDLVIVATWTDRESKVTWSRTSIMLMFSPTQYFLPLFTSTSAGSITSVSRATRPPLTFGAP
jgi:hypothetical protein